MQIERHELENLETQFVVTTEKDDLETAQNEALHELSKEITIPGFRKGNAPSTEVKKRVGDLRLLQEMLEILIDRGYRQVISDNKNLRPISEPKIEIQNEESFVAEGGNLTFSITITNRPQITLPDYKDLEVTFEHAEATDQEVDDTINELFSRWKNDHNDQEDAAPAIETATSITEAKQKAEAQSQQTDNKLIGKTKDQPDDEWAQFVGAQDMTDLKVRLKQNIILEKTYASGNKFTQDILDNLFEKTKADLPHNMILDDLEKREKAKQEDLEKIGLDLEGFAKQHKLSIEELNERWLQDIRKEYVLEFALDTIATQENIDVTDEELDTEIKASKSAENLKLFQDPDRREHLRYMMRRDKVIGQLVEWNYDHQKQNEPKTDTQNKPANKTKKTTAKKSVKK